MSKEELVADQFKQLREVEIPRAIIALLEERGGFAEIREGDGETVVRSIVDKAVDEGRIDPALAEALIAHEVVDRDISRTMSNGTGVASEQDAMESPSLTLNRKPGEWER